MGRTFNDLWTVSSDEFKRAYKEIDVGHLSVEHLKELIPHIDDVLWNALLKVSKLKMGDPLNYPILNSLAVCATSFYEEDTRSLMPEALEYLQQAGDGLNGKIAAIFSHFIVKAYKAGHIQLNQYEETPSATGASEQEKVARIVFTNAANLAMLYRDKVLTTPLEGTQTVDDSESELRFFITNQLKEDFQALGLFDRPSFSKTVDSMLIHQVQYTELFLDTEFKYDPDSIQETCQTILTPQNKTAHPAPYMFALATRGFFKQIGIGAGNSDLDSAYESLTEAVAVEATLQNPAHRTAFPYINLAVVQALQYKNNPALAQTTLEKAFQIKEGNHNFDRHIAYQKRVLQSSSSTGLEREQAIIWLGLVHQYGLFGVKSDHETALEYYNSAEVPSPNGSLNGSPTSSPKSIKSTASTSSHSSSGSGASSKGSSSASAASQSILGNLPFVDMQRKLIQKESPSSSKEDIQVVAENAAKKAMKGHMEYTRAAVAAVTKVAQAQAVVSKQLNAHVQHQGVRLDDHEVRIQSLEQSLKLLKDESKKVEDAYISCLQEPFRPFYTAMTGELTAELMAEKIKSTATFGLEADPKNPKDLAAGLLNLCSHLTKSIPGVSEVLSVAGFLTQVLGDYVEEKKAADVRDTILFDDRLTNALSKMLARYWAGRLATQINVLTAKGARNLGHDVAQSFLIHFVKKSTKIGLQDFFSQIFIAPVLHSEEIKGVFGEKHYQVDKKKIAKGFSTPVFTFPGIIKSALVAKTPDGEYWYLENVRRSAKEAVSNASKYGAQFVDMDTMRAALEGFQKHYPRLAISRLGQVEAKDSSTVFMKGPTQQLLFRQLPEGMQPTTLEERQQIAEQFGVTDDLKYKLKAF